METLSASVQYNDWKGTAAADNADQTSFAKLLESKGVLDRKTEFLVATSLFIGENHNGKVEAPFIDALIAPYNNMDAAQANLSANSDPLHLRRVSVELTLEEFIGLFKRFNVVLTRNGLNLDGRGYTAT